MLESEKYLWTLTFGRGKSHVSTAHHISILTGVNLRSYQVGLKRPLPSSPRTPGQE